MNAITTYDPALNPAVTLTASAIAHVKKEITKHKAIGLRLGVKKAGCSGYKYVVDYVHMPEKNDRVISIEDELTVYIDSESLLKLYGLKIDYIKEGLNGKLVFINPNEKSSCGCGESFST